MHVILFGVHPKIRQPLRDGVIVAGDIHCVINDVAGVRHPLTAHHELIVHIVAERVAHRAVPAAHAHAREGRHVAQEGHLEEPAEAHLRQAAQLQPSLRRAQVNLGMLLARTNREEESLYCFANAGLSEAAARKLSEGLQ